MILTSQQAKGFIAKPLSSKIKSLVLPVACNHPLIKTDFLRVGGWICLLNGCVVEGWGVGRVDGREALRVNEKGKGVWGKGGRKVDGDVLLHQRFLGQRPS